MNPKHKARLIGKYHAECRCGFSAFSNDTRVLKEMCAEHQQEQKRIEQYKPLSVSLSTVEAYKKFPIAKGKAPRSSGAGDSR